MIARKWLAAVLKYFILKHKITDRDTILKLKVSRNYASALVLEGGNPLSARPILTYLPTAYRRSDGAEWEWEGEAVYDNLNKLGIHYKDR